MKQTAEQFARDYARQIADQMRRFDFKAFAAFAKELERVRRLGRTVFVMGNGGSAGSSSHIATDLAKTASVEGCPKLKAISLTDNTCLVTAIANDISYDEIFVEQLKLLAQPNDLIVLISGSGKSPNVVRAAEYARSKKIKTVGLLGFDGGKLLPLVDIALHVKSTQYGVVEDLHMSVGHMAAFYFKQLNLHSRKSK